jgi:hypothetical protein
MTDSRVKANATTVDEHPPVHGEAPTTVATPSPTPYVTLRRAWRTRDQAIGLAVGGVYALLVMALWLPFGPRNGMGYETTLVYFSESQSFLDGFLYSDPLRRFTQLFYQSGYQLSNVLGIDGSFLGNQLVYAALWWGRGFLAFLILRRLFPSVPLLAYAAGALVIVHASDHALNWVGQLNQFGVIFWMMLALYLLVVALQETRPIATVLFGAAAAVATYLCLWSYESPLFILLLAPLLLLPLVGLSRQTTAIFGLFYLFPLVFVLRNMDRYFGGDSGTYQESVLRDDLTPTRLAKDLAYNVEASVQFWKWGDLLPPVASPGRATLAGVAAATAFAVGALLVALLARHREDSLSRRNIAFVFGAGALVLVGSFPAYVVLNDARSLWRTQFLSGIGFGIATAALLVLAVSFIPNRRLRVVAIAGAGALVAYAGGSTAYKAAHYHYDVWQRHREAIAQVLDVAPRVEPETVIVLTNLQTDPFGHNMWFDVALRLAYPRTAVAGIYYRRGGAPSPGANLVVNGDEWSQVATGYPTLLYETPFSHTVIIRYSASGEPTLVRGVPRFLDAGKKARAAYNPRAVIEAGDPSPLAERRYDRDAG